MSATSPFRPRELLSTTLERLPVPEAMLYLFRLAEKAHNIASANGSLLHNTETPETLSLVEAHMDIKMEHLEPHIYTYEVCLKGRGLPTYFVAGQDLPLIEILRRALNPSGTDLAPFFSPVLNSGSG